MDMSYYFCRLCAFKCMQPGLMIFSAEGVLRDIPKKIEECLQFGVIICTIPSHLLFIIKAFLCVLFSNHIKQIAEDDTYPKTICFDCVYQLDVSYEFKVKCLHSQNFLSGKCCAWANLKFLSSPHNASYSVG